MVEVLCPVSPKSEGEKSFEPLFCAMPGKIERPSNKITRVRNVCVLKQSKGWRERGDICDGWMGRVAGHKSMRPRRINGGSYRAATVEEDEEEEDNDDDFTRTVSGAGTTMISIRVFSL